MTTISEKIENVLNANEGNLPLPKKERMKANSEERDNLLNVDKENLPFAAILREQ